MGIYPNRGLEYMFQFKMALPLNILDMVSENGLYQPMYFPDVNRLLVIPMKASDDRLAASKYYQERSSKFFSPVSHCRRIDSPIDVQLSPEEHAFINKIANTPGLQDCIEHHGWYDSNYVSCTLGSGIKNDSPHEKP